MESKLVLTYFDITSLPGSSGLSELLGVMVSSSVNLVQKRHLFKILKSLNPVFEEFESDKKELLDKFAVKDENGKNVDPMKFTDQEQLDKEYKILLDEEKTITMEEKTKNILCDCITNADPKIIDAKNIRVYCKLCDLLGVEPNEKVDPESHPEQVPAGK